MNTTRQEYQELQVQLTYHLANAIALSKEL